MQIKKGKDEFGKYLKDPEKINKEDKQQQLIIFREKILNYEEMIQNRQEEIKEIGEYFLIVVNIFKKNIT